MKCIYRGSKDLQTLEDHRRTAGLLRTVEGPEDPLGPAKASGTSESQQIPAFPSISQQIPAYTRRVPQIHAEIRWDLGVVRPKNPPQNPNPTPPTPHTPRSILSQFFPFQGVLRALDEASGVLRSLRWPQESCGSVDPLRSLPFPRGLTGGRPSDPVRLHFMCISGGL